MDSAAPAAEEVGMQASPGPILEVADLTMHFGSITAAEGENLSVQRGELIGIVGPNGAGKTTFLNLVTGYLRPEEGSIRFQGHEIVGMRPNEIVRLGIGRSFQVPQLFVSLTVLENVLVALATAEGRSQNPWSPLRTPERTRHAERLLEQFMLADLAQRPAGELPEGARKLLDIVLAYALAPQLLLLDEPTSSVSAQDKIPLMETLVGVLSDASVTTMFIEHDLDVVRRFARRVLVLSNGSFIADGDPQTVLDDPEIRRAVAGWQ